MRYTGFSFSIIIYAALISFSALFPGRKFVSILMRFWYLTSAHIPDDNMEGTRIFQVAIGGEGEAETKRLLTANYELVYRSCAYEVLKQANLCVTSNILF